MTNAKVVADAVGRVVASRARTAKQRAVTKARAVVVVADAVTVVAKVAAMDAQAVAGVAVVVTDPLRVHVSVLMPMENPSVQKQQATCKQQPRGSIKMQQGQNSRPIVHRATRNVATVVAVVAANALKTQSQETPVNAMNLVQKDAMSVAQSALVALMKPLEWKHQHRARQTPRQ